MKRSYMWMAGLGLALGLISGCEEAQLNPTLTQSMQKIAIMPVVNKTSQPNVDQTLTQKITQAFIVNGRLKVTEKADADVYLQETLQRYDNIVLARDASDVPIRYKLQIIVDADLMDAKTGKTLMTTRTTDDTNPGAEDDNSDAADSDNGNGAAVDANGNPTAQFDDTSARSMREFTTYYVINNVGMPPEDQPTAEGRVTDQMADHVVRWVVEGY